METFHTIGIGGGINNLVCAAILAKSGKKVLLLESTDYLGGCIRSQQVEGCIIDPLSTAYPLFVTSPSYAALKEDLEKNGVEFVTNNVPTASVLSDKRFAILKTGRENNVASLNALLSGEGDAYAQQMQWVEQHAELLFTLLGSELWSKTVLKYLLKYAWKNGLTKSFQNVAGFVPSVRNDIPNHFKTQELQAVMAPWVLHTGLSTESLFSSTMSKIIAMTVEMVGLPLVKGGSYKMVAGLKAIIEKNGGTCITQKHVEEILISSDGRAEGVRCKDGSVYKAKHVVASVTPHQLYQKLIAKQTLIDEPVKQQVNNYKYGKGNMQIHLILKEKPQWFNTDLDQVVYVHLTDGINDVSRAVNEATRQCLPHRGTVCIAQPSAVDPSRASDGKYVVWIQLPECPNFPQEDTSGELSHLCKGEWTDELKNAYADRILKRISGYISNIETACIYRQVISPKDLSAMNINLVNGDPYAGLCEMDQYLLWRPLRATKNHNTPIKNLYHIGASTHPGPGLGGVSGFQVAQTLMKK